MWMMVECYPRSVFNHCCCLRATLRGRLKMGFGLGAGAVVAKRGISLMQDMSLMLMAGVVTFAYG